MRQTIKSKSFTEPWLVSKSSEPIHPPQSTEILQRRDRETEQRRGWLQQHTVDESKQTARGAVESILGFLVSPRLPHPHLPRMPVYLMSSVELICSCDWKHFR
jgi:hypothetical protein